MDKDTINKLLENIDLLIERNNIINQQVTRILFLCLNNQDINNKNNLLDKLTHINENLSKDILYVTDTLRGINESLSDNIKTVKDTLINNINTVNYTLINNFNELCGKILEVNTKADENSGKLNDLKDSITDVKNYLVQIISEFSKFGKQIETSAREVTSNPSRLSILEDRILKIEYYLQQIMIHIGATITN